MNRAEKVILAVAIFFLTGIALIPMDDVNLAGKTILSGVVIAGWGFFSAIVREPRPIDPGQVPLGRSRTWSRDTPPRAEGNDPPPPPPRPLRPPRLVGSNDPIRDATRLFGIAMAALIELEDPARDRAAEATATLRSGLADMGLIDREPRPTRPDPGE